MNEERIARVAEEAAKILKDYPHLKYVQAVEKAKEVLGYGAHARDKSNNIQD